MNFAGIFMVAIFELITVVSDFIFGSFYTIISNLLFYLNCQIKLEKTTCSFVMYFMNTSSGVL